MLCILGFLLPRGAGRNLHNSWGAHSFAWGLLLNIRSELWIKNAENSQYLQRGVWCIYLALHSHLFRNVKLYFLNQSGFFFLFTSTCFRHHDILDATTCRWSSNNHHIPLCTAVHPPVCQGPEGDVLHLCSSFREVLGFCRPTGNWSLFSLPW